MIKGFKAHGDSASAKAYMKEEELKKEAEQAKKPSEEDLKEVIKEGKQD